MFLGVRRCSEVLGVYRERSLRSATNYFIVSLAIADIMVAILVMPLAVYVEVKKSILLSLISKYVSK